MSKTNREISVRQVEAEINYSSLAELFANLFRKRGDIGEQPDGEEK